MATTILTSEAQHYICINIIERDKNECWKFLNIGHSYIHKEGYGMIRYRKNGKTIHCLAHRLSYLYYNKMTELDDSVYVLHKCDNPPCINPNHLFLGSNQINVKDMVSKMRHSYGEHRPSAKLIESQIIEIRKKYAKGVTLTELYKEYGTSISNIGHIVEGRSWKHLK